MSGLMGGTAADTVPTVVDAGATAAVQQQAGEVLLDTYGTPPLAFVRGQGTTLFDVEDRPYLDFLCGLAVTSLGHSHPAVTRAIGEQAATLLHTSNLYLTQPALDLADTLAELAGWPDGRAFFAQCGATANEAAIKLARRHGLEQSATKVRLVTLEGSFHGRTLATLEATGQPAKHTRFAPLAGFVDTVPFDDPEALAAAVTDDTCGVLVEMVQGEGGVRPLSDEMVVAAREACDRAGALLLVDEVQTGIGRTGMWFAWQQRDHLGVEPDGFTLAKALGNGVPIGALVARGAAAKAFQPGDHATTFGGNPLTCAAANAVLATIRSEGLLTTSAVRSRRLVESVEAMAGKVPYVAGIRGLGLLLAVELDAPVAKAVEVACRDHGLLVNAVAPDALRLAPPLTVSRAEVDRALAIVRAACEEVAGGAGEVAS